MNIKIIAKYITLALFTLGAVPIAASEQATTNQTLAQQIDATFGLAEVLGSYQASGKTMLDRLEFLFKLRMHISLRAEIDEEFGALRESNARFKDFPEFYFRILSDEEYRRLCVIFQEDESRITSFVAKIIPRVEQEISRENTLTPDQRRLNKILDGFVKFLVNLPVDDSRSDLSSKCKSLVDGLLVDDDYAKLAYNRFKENLNRPGYSFRCGTMLHVLSQYLLSTRKLRQGVVNAVSEVINDRRGLSEEEVSAVSEELFGLSIDLGYRTSSPEQFAKEIIQEARKLDRDSEEIFDEVFERYKETFGDPRQDIGSRPTTASSRGSASGEDSDGSVERRSPDREREQALVRENAARSRGVRPNKLSKDEKLLRELQEMRRLRENSAARPMSRAGLATSTGLRPKTAQQTAPRNDQQRTTSPQNAIDSRYIKVS